MTAALSFEPARIALMLTELHLPTMGRLWSQFAERSDQEGWPAGRFLAALLEHELAEQGRRTAAPNPVVGSVLVRDGEVLGEGWHDRPGSEHAEAMALRLAGEARGATAYVSLEPCAHHGRTPP